MNYMYSVFKVTTSVINTYVMNIPENFEFVEITKFDGDILMVFKAPQPGGESD